MKVGRVGLALAAAVLTLSIASEAVAGRGGRSGGHGGGHWGGHASSGFRGGHFGGGARFVPRFRTTFFVGAPLFAPFYFYPPPPPYYFLPPVIVSPAPVYVEPYPAQPAPQQPQYWHYCASSQSYYPYVKECPEGWQQVAPQPPS